MTLGVRLVETADRRPHTMRLDAITLVVFACVWLTDADVTHLKAAKAKLLSRLAGKHHKRGIYSAVPPFKLGHDIPHVTHSVVKPLVVTYPPTAAVAAVKVPVTPPYSRFPVPVGHKVHSHFGLKHPHHTKTVVVPKPDQHFHHHHHHVAPKPVVPVLPAPPVIPATPLVPVPQPAGTVVQPVPVPSPPVAVHPAPQPILPVQPFPIASPPSPFFPPPVPFKPLVPLTPIQPAQAVNVPSFPLSHQFPYVIRPGNAIQSSFFATYPRYPLVNYQNPILPLPPAPAPLLPTRFYNHPHYHQLAPQAGEHGFYEQPVPAQHVAVEHQPSTFLNPTQTVVPQHGVHLQPAQPNTHLHPDEPSLHLQPAQPTYIHTAEPSLHLHPTDPSLHLQPAQPNFHAQPTYSAVPLDHDGWSPVPSQHNLSPAQPDGLFQQPLDSHHFTQEQGTQVYEHHSGNDQFHEYQDQLQHHIQQQLDQAQHEQNSNQQHQLSQEYGAPQHEYGAPQQEYVQPNQDFQQNHNFAQHAHEYAQHVQEYAQHGQEYAQTNEYNLQNGYQSEQEYHQNQAEQDYSQPGHEYGLPQGIEGRSGEEDGDTQLRYHNHIPLGLQPPIDRPLEHFR